tara:strand:+ start:32981 stop:34378 length:1398 start_codon:yes stop_codon:yes gene_type:complete
MKPFFSIILPTYNQAKFLETSVKSILNQTYENWELLIIDNCSKDETQKVINSFQDKRINSFKINNKGILANSRNFGIKKAKAEWICFLDSDDRWFPKKLLEVKKYIDQYEGDLYYHDLVFENKGLLFKKKISDKSKTIKKPILKYFSENGNPIGQSSVVVKKNILKRVNYISVDKEKFSWEDFDTWIKICKITDKFIRVPITLGSIWIGGENISNLERQIINTKKIKKHYYKTFNKYLSKKNKNKNLWWLEYPSILKDFRKQNLDSLKKRLNSITVTPLKFVIIFFCMRHILYLKKILRKMKSFFTVIFLFKNIKKIQIINLHNQKYRKINNYKDLSKITFDNFEIPNEFFERIKNNFELHILFQNKNLFTYGWSSKKKTFLISEINCEIINDQNVIFFDFFTIKSYRKKGFYKLLLKKMLTNFKSKNCYIYTTFLNFKSMRAIKNSNFEFKNLITIFKKKINLS